MVPAIESRSLRREYGDTVAVRDLSMTVPRGTVYGFLGPNGAGKTTTMRMLTTLLEPTAGSARIVGEPISDRDRVTPHVGYLPEESPVYPELTGREQLSYLAGLRGLDADERVAALLDRFSLSDAADQRVGTYSKGMKRKLGLVATLMHDPEVIFLDEPTSGLDPRTARTVRETVADIAEEGVTVVLSTHILPVVEDLADTVGVVYDGRLVAEGPPTDLQRQVETDGDDGLEGVFLEVTRDRSAGTVEQ